MFQPRPLFWLRAGQTVSNSFGLSAKQSSRTSNFNVFCLTRWLCSTIENLKCTEWSETDREHLMLKNTLYIQSIPEVQMLVHFALWPAVYKIQDCWKSKEIQMNQMTAEWPVYIKYCPHVAEVTNVCNPIENLRCNEWSETDLEHLKCSKIPYIYTKYPRSPNFGQFRSMDGRL